MRFGNEVGITACLTSSTSTQSPFTTSLTSSRLLSTTATSREVSVSPTPNLTRLSVMFLLLDRLYRISVLRERVFIVPLLSDKHALFAATASCKGSATSADFTTAQFSCPVITFDLISAALVTFTHK